MIVKSVIYEVVLSANSKCLLVDTPSLPSPSRPAPPPPVPPHGAGLGIALPGLTSGSSLPETPVSPPPQVKIALFVK